MASIIGEVVNPIMAEIVMDESVVMYDGEFVSCMRGMTVEEVYVRLDKELESIGIDSKKRDTITQEEYRKIIFAQLQNQTLESILACLCELYRRNINLVEDPYAKWWEIYDIEETPDDRYGNKYELFWGCFHKYKQPVKDALKKIRKIREIHSTSLKKEMMHREINELMDSILNSNLQNLVEFKKYLTPQHYRLILSNADITEFKDPDILLASLRRMKLER